MTAILCFVLAYLSGHRCLHTIDLPFRYPPSGHIVGQQHTEGGKACLKIQNIAGAQDDNHMVEVTSGSSPPMQAKLLIF